jgi:hypothetical protein
MRLRIRITKLPPAAEFEGFDLRRFEIGCVYDVGIRLAELLVFAGFATIEMRMNERAGDDSEASKT